MINKSLGYTVELRFTLDKYPLKITEILGLNPTNWSSEISRRPKGAGLWAYNGHHENGFKEEWGSLDEGFRFILEKIRPIKKEIITISKRHEAIWWCGCFYVSLNESFIISSEVIGEIAEYGLPLFFDNYFSENIE